MSNGKSKDINMYECESSELRRGPWTLEEDNLLIQYISSHGEGRWNSLAKFAGLKRTGKSCRLRWLNYLKPDIKRGNLTPHEQLLILELHSKWGNRWSKIAQNLPGRTDNEIKNYWRTRVQKQARQLKVDSNSKKFLEAIRTFWMPRLMEKMATSSPSSSLSLSVSLSTMETHSAAAASSPPAITHLQPPTESLCQKTSTNLVINDSDTKFLQQIISSPISPPSVNLITAVKNNTSNNRLEIPIEDEDEDEDEDEESYYNVNVGFPFPSCCYDDMDMDMEMEGQNIPLPDLHVSEVDWFGESTFWNSDELWQFRK